MIENNKLDKFFGPLGSIFGIVILLFGIYATYYSWVGLTTIIVGAFLGFSYTSTKIDFENKRVKFTNNLFGIFSIGAWTELDSSMKLAVANTTKTQNTYSQSNRKNSLTEQDYRIKLFNEKGNEILTIKKFAKKEDALAELETLANKLGVQV